jgi:hypothetical protein
VIIECEHCEALTDHENLGSFESFDQEAGLPERFTFLKCPVCSSAALAGQEWYAEDTWSDPYRLYPPRLKRLSIAIPPPLRSAYKEALICHKAKAYTAAAIMCRKTLEGLCDNHGATSRSLASGLRKLKEDGVIDQRLFDWADALRIMGNEAAHGADFSVDADDAKDVLDFVEAILDYVYVYRKRFDEFIERRQARAQEEVEELGDPASKRSRRASDAKSH